MAKYNSSRFVDNRVRETFELVISAEGEPEKVVVFKDPNRLPVGEAFKLEEKSKEDPTALLKALLGDQFDEFWAVWQNYDGEALTNLVEAVTEHFRD